MGPGARLARGARRDGPLVRDAARLVGAAPGPRSGRRDGLALTPAGKLYAELCRDVLWRGAQFEAALDALERLGRADRDIALPSAPKKPRAATWVTRRGIQVDRIASAWLIRRFIDIEARFRFVDPARHKPKKGEIRFDMFEAEYGHAEGRCTFETLLNSFTLKDAALASIAEMIHDLDLKDGRFARPETAGLGRLLAGIAALHRDDRVRLDAGGAAFDALYTDWLQRGDHAVAAAEQAPYEPRRSVGRLVVETLPYDYTQFGSLPGVA